MRRLEPDGCELGRAGCATGGAVDDEEAAEAVGGPSTDREVEDRLTVFGSA
jgi:hypothetical protein